MTRRCGMLLPALVAFLAAPSSAEEVTAPAETFDLRYLPEVGVPVEWTGDLDVEAWAGPGERKLTCDVACPFEFVETALAIVEGRVVEKRREYRQWGLETRLGGQPVHADRRSFVEGADLRFRRAGDAVEVESLGSPMEPRDLEILEKHFEYLPEFGPDHRVALGETWSFADRDILPILAAARSAQFHAARLECRLDRIEVRDGRRVAVVPIRGVATARLYTLAFLAMKGDITGEALYDLDGARPISLVLLGLLQGESFELGSENAVEIQSGGKFDVSVAWEVLSPPPPESENSGSGSR